jgi:hypothetical protein
MTTTEQRRLLANARNRQSKARKREARRTEKAEYRERMFPLFQDMLNGDQQCGGGRRVLRK